VSNDERSESLAAQAAAWVPPWERQRPEPDRAYQAARAAEATEGPDDDEDRSAAGLSDDDDDFDPAFEGGNPPGYAAGTEDAEDAEDAADRAGETVVPELPPFAGETAGPVAVDAPQELPGEREPDPTEIHIGGEVPMPPAVEHANEVAEAGEGDFATVDAPVPDGGDAGGMFDAAADDDVSDDDEVDLPFDEDIPAADDDEAPDSTDEAPDSTDEAPPAADEAPPAADEAPSAADEAPSAADEAPETADDAAPATDSDGVAGIGAVEAYAAGFSDGEEAFGAAPSARAGDRSGNSAAQLPGLGVPAQGRKSRERAAAPVDAAPRTDEVNAEGDPAAEMSDAELAGALESIMLVVDEPVVEMQLAQILEQPTERVGAMLDDLSARYTAAGHGFDLRRAAGGWRLYTRPEYAPYVERFVLDGQSVRLTQAALETLAVVAYKQPVTRSRISAIRGVNCDGVMRTLATRGLIEECGTEGETGAHLYRTTALFLEKLGLNSVDQLPPLAPFLPDDVEEVLDATG
jgi:segregation and condensation protein B